MIHSYVVYFCLLFFSQVQEGHQGTSCNRVAWQMSYGCCGDKTVASLVTHGDLNYFTDEMKRRNLTSVWTGLTRKILPTWTWMDNSTDFPNSMNDGADTARCALLDAEKKQMERELCGARGKGHICEKKGCSSCSELAASTCVQIDNKCYIYFCDEVNFDKARTKCLKAGYDLARLPSNFSRLLIGQQYCKQFWIGLRREDWLSVEEGTGSRHVSLWLPPEPSEDGKCSVMNWDRVSFTWKAVPCTERHRVICGKQTRKDLTSRGPTASGLTSAMPFTSQTSTKQTPGGRNTQLLEIFVGIGAGALLLIVITIICFIWRRKRKSRHKLRNGQQEGGTNVSLLYKKLSMKEFRQNIAKKLLRQHQRIELWSFQEDFVDMELDEIYTDMMWTTLEGHYHCDDKVQHNYLHIFNKNKDGLRPVRILVLGEAGVGKTTFIKKMLVDWSRGVITMGKTFRVQKGLERVFTCVVPVFLRDISEGEPFSSIIRRQLQINDSTCDRIMQEITHNPKRILLILDGYDEFRENHCKDILHIIEGNMFQDISLLITCRTPYLFYLPDKKGRADVKVHLQGFSNQSIKLYIDRYFEKKKKPSTENINVEGETTVKQLSSLGTPDKEETLTQASSLIVHSREDKGLYDKIQSKKELEEMSRVPAVLLLMCILWNDRGDLANTLTGFYQDFIKYMCQRYAKKYIKDKKIVHTEIFKHFRKELMKLGEIAFDGLKGENIGLLFPREVINKIMEQDDVTMKLGFLREVERTSENIYFSFYHKTIQEFFTAYYIVECDKNTRLQLLMSFCSSKHRAQESKQILRFVVGLGGYGVKYHVEEAMSGWTEDAIRDKITFQLTYLDENMDVKFELPPVVKIEMSSSHKASTYTRFFKMPAGDVEELHMIVVDLTVMCYLREMTAPNLKVLSVSLSNELPALYPQKELRENCQMEEMLTNFPLQQLAFKDFKKDNSRHIVSLCKNLDCVETLKSLDLRSCELLSDSVQELKNNLPRLMEKQRLRLGDIK